MSALAVQPAAVDLSVSIDLFLGAAETLFDNLTAIGWGALLVALALWAGMLLARAHAWANALRAAYPPRQVKERFIAAAFVAGAGFNGFLPARAGDAVKLVLAKRSIPGSSYPAVLASFAVFAPFDTTLAVAVIIGALGLGLLPEPPALPNVPAFEISFWADHPALLIAFLAALALGATAAFAYLGRRAEAFWQRVRQGLAILTAPRRYLRDVAAWQLVGWLLRFFSFWFFLEAFHIGGSVENVLVVMAVESVSKALPLTPGGAGAQQALLVASLGGAPVAAVLSFSVGQQIAAAVWAAVLGFASLIVVFGISDWRRVLAQARAAQAEAKRAPVLTPEPTPGEPGGP